MSSCALNAELPIASPEDLATICASVRSGATPAAVRVEAFLARIAQHDGVIHAFNEVHADAARARARAIDKMVASGRDPGSLAGCVIAM